MVTYYLEYGRHVARLRFRHRRRAHASTSNTAGHIIILGYLKKDTNNMVLVIVTANCLKKKFIL